VSTVVEARAAALRAHPSVPLITDCTQGRVELSHITFDNWVTKTVNHLQMECDIGEGARVAVTLPLHWMTAVWLVSVWESGAEVVLSGPADLRVGSAAGADVVVVADPLGMAPAPAGVSADWFFPADVRGMPDQPVLPRPARPGGLAGIDAQALMGLAGEYAARVGLAGGGRLATDLDPVSTVGVLAAIAAPLAVGASVVYGDAAQESCTAIAVP
jgi:uncharacterized protein (TIGR03089 family)